MQYDWDTQYKLGTKFEERLDRFYSGCYKILRAKPPDQRRGIDRFYCEGIEHGPSGQEKTWSHWFSVEYKADVRSSLSGNLFYELEQEVDGEIILGWGQKIMAQILILYIPGSGWAYWLNVATVKLFMSEWLAQHPIKECKNTDGRIARGLLIPLKNLITNCSQREDFICGE